MGNKNSNFQFLTDEVVDSQCLITSNKAPSGRGGLVIHDYVGIKDLCVRINPQTAMRITCSSLIPEACTKSVWSANLGCNPSDAAVTSTRFTPCVRSNFEIPKSYGLLGVRYSEIFTFVSYRNSPDCSGTPTGTVVLPSGVCQQILPGNSFLNQLSGTTEVISTNFQSSDCSANSASDSDTVFVPIGKCQADSGGSSRMIILGVSYITADGTLVTYDDAICNSQCINIIIIVASCIGGVLVLCIGLCFVRRCFRTRPPTMQKPTEVNVTLNSPFSSRTEPQATGQAWQNSNRNPSNGNLNQGSPFSSTTASSPVEISSFTAPPAPAVTNMPASHQQIALQ